jgi:hypothetical protein
VLVFIKNSLSAVGRGLSVGETNAVEINFQYDEKDFCLLAIYRTHDSNLLHFIDSLNDYYNNTNRGKTNIMVGDININILGHDLQTDLYLDVLYEKGFISCIDKPTRQQRDSSTLIDHIFINNVDISLIESSIVKVSVTDHYIEAIQIISSFNEKDASDPPKYYIDDKKLFSLLGEETWTSVLSEQEVNNAANKLYLIIKSNIEKSKKTSCSSKFSF